MSFDTIDLLTGNVFQVTWDIGPRCNYDCSYCPAHRHDNFSKHATLNELKSNADFMFEYIDTYMNYRNYKNANINFTGGEPTVNPNFIPFIQYLTHKYQQEYLDKWEANFSLTTNGAMSKHIASEVIKNMKYCTVSYHAESSNMLKQQVKDRIVQFYTEGKDYNFKVSVNVMFHASYFDECKEMCNFLDSMNISYVPRIIGEEAGSKSNFAHQYSDEQLDYLKNYWNYKNSKVNNETEISSKLSAVGDPKNEKQKVQDANKKEGWAIGRPCCGSREMCLSLQESSKKATFVDFRNFKGWYCSVNYFFLHLEQKTDSVYHHQTCQARFDQTRGSIGKISEGKKIIENLKKQIKNNSLPVIVCPKQTCGCGLCAPKSAYYENYQQVLSKHVSKKILEATKIQVPKIPPIIPKEKN